LEINDEFSRKDAKKYLSPLRFLAAPAENRSAFARNLFLIFYFSQRRRGRKEKIIEFNTNSLSYSYETEVAHAPGSEQGA